ncbi:MAG: oligosaccharide flippase family protein [Sandaracinaceae bacterium]|nr:oligosaccharide flippase family protein [Sandaracinaceae bacterium]
MTAAVTKLLLGSGAAAVLGFVTTAVAARALGPDGYGNVVVVRSFAAAVAAFASFQTPVAIIRFGAAALAGKSTPRLATLVRGGLLIDTASALVGGVAGAVVGWALIPTLGLEPAVRPWLFVYLVGVPLVVQGVPSAVLRLYDRYSAYAAVLVICAAGRLALVGGCGYHSPLAGGTTRRLPRPRPDPGRSSLGQLRCARSHEMG